MNLAALLALNPAGLWKALTTGGIKPIDAKSWTLSIDDESFGNCIASHTVGADDKGPWAKWTYEYDDDRDPDSPKKKGEVQSWITSGGRHIIKVDGKDVEKDSVRVRVTTVGVFPPKGVVIVLHRFVDGSGDGREYRFDGRL